MWTSPPKTKCSTTYLKMWSTGAEGFAQWFRPCIILGGSDHVSNTPFWPLCGWHSHAQAEIDINKLNAEKISSYNPIGCMLFEELHCFTLWIKEERQGMGTKSHYWKMSKWNRNIGNPAKICAYIQWPE